MNASNRNERNGPPLSVTIVTTGNSSPVSRSTGRVLDHRMAEHGLVVRERELDGIDGVELVRRRGHVEPCSYLLQSSRQPASRHVPPAVGLELR